MDVCSNSCQSSNLANFRCKFWINDKPDSVIPLSTYTLYLIPESNFNVIHDSVLTSLNYNTFHLLYLILLYPILLCLIPFLHYTQFCYTWFSYGSFHLYVIPDSWTKLQCYTWFRYTSFRYNTSDFFVIHDSIIPNSVISVSSFLCYTRFGYAWFCYTRVRYDWFPVPIWPYNTFRESQKLFKFWVNELTGVHRSSCQFWLSDHIGVVIYDHIIIPTGVP